MSIPDMRHIVESTKADYPRAWEHCHHAGDPEAHDFIILAARRMYDDNQLFGLNGKRGTADLSWDAVNWKGDSDDPPNVIDCVGGAGGPNPQPAWQVTNTTGAYFNPYDYHTHYTYTDEGGETGGEGEGGSGGGGSTSKPPYAGDSVWWEKLGLPLEADMALAGQTLNAGSSVWFARVGYDHYVMGMTIDDAVAKHRAEWRQVLGLPPL